MLTFVNTVAGGKRPQKGKNLAEETDDQAVLSMVMQDEYLEELEPAYEEFIQNEPKKAAVQSKVLGIKQFKKFLGSDAHEDAEGPLKLALEQLPKLSEEAQLMFWKFLGGSVKKEALLAPAKPKAAPKKSTSAAKASTATTSKASTVAGTSTSSKSYPI